ncbi:Arabinanase/levansucrase/invertase [Eremomyces bilateralis CBS 781.70]|uniref:Arabinanase/levansucrase/invertase n=1 Tax=Eremomyces bilateralis CBS 781.70 TaxID=1392243 RepID=A0A6G1FWM5_9PEZI|nr:Arabinanase/levansucrase/invertase [Eremomyces bilateralis CBS 781.70]KAF1810237.1 Arabinanase/levansucrase/invertase [Eremomyces bilateralis CBS 781.70]
MVNGPVIIEDFADPAFYRDVDFWHAFATCNQNQSVNIQMARSRDFDKWERIVDDALPDLPRWVNLPMPFVWAPSVTCLDNGTYILYYAASMASDPRFHCIGVASSDNITGPYDPDPEPWACALERGGAIDASAFQDVSGQRYVVYKIDGNSLGSGGACNNGIPPIQPTPIMLQAVAADGVTKQGKATQILDRTDKDGPLVEAPSIHQAADGSYVLFYSSGCFSDPSYDIRWASANDIRGPYTRFGTLLKTGMMGLTAPGGADVIDGGRMMFHADFGKGRAMYTTQVAHGGAAVRLVQYDG